MLAWYDRLLNSSSDVAGGFGDFITGGATHWLRNHFTGIYGENGGVNVCSGFYTGGQIAGAAWQAAFITAGILNAIEAGLSVETEALSPFERGILNEERALTDLGLEGNTTKVFTSEGGAMPAFTRLHAQSTVPGLP